MSGIYDYIINRGKRKRADGIPAPMIDAESMARSYASTVPPSGVAESKGWLTGTELEEEQAKGNGEVYTLPDHKEPVDRHDRKPVDVDADGNPDGIAFSPAVDKGTGESAAESAVAEAASKTAKGDGKANTTINALAGETAPGETDNGVVVKNGYEDILNYLKASQLNEADAQKRQRKREMWASIGDGISALSNLYQTTKGGVQAYNPDSNMTTELQKRGERMAKERAAMSDQYLAYLKAQRMADQEAEQQAYRRDMMELKRDQLEQQRERAAAVEKRHQDRLRLQKDLQEDKQYTAAEKSYILSQYLYYRDTEGREDSEARALAANDARMEKERQIANDQAKSDANVKKTEQTGEAAIIKANKTGTKKSSGTKKKKQSSLYGKKKLY